MGAEATQELVVDVEDGIYTDVPDSVYRSWPRVSPSMLEYGFRSMAHMKAAMDGQLRKDTDALEFGRSFHCRLLEPARFRREYSIAQPCSAMTQPKSKNATPTPCSRMGTCRVGGQWFCSQHTEDGAAEDVGEIISQEEHDTIERLAASVFRHPIVQLIRQKGGCEVSMAWTDRQTGIKCKGRLDKLIPDCIFPDGAPKADTALDPKAMANIEPGAVSKAIYNYGWHHRVAMYQSGYLTLTGKPLTYYLVPIEKEPPHIVTCGPLSEDSLSLGRQEFRAKLQAWAYAVKNDKFGWEGDNEFIEFDLPAWVMKQNENVELEIGGQKVSM